MTRTATVRSLLLACVVATAGLVGPATSQGAVTIGSGLSPDADSNICGAFPCTFWQTELTLAGRAAAGGVASPMNGVIVRWRLKAGSANGAPINLRVIRPGAGSTYTGAGTSATANVTVTGVSTFAARVPVKIGDYIGLNDGASGLYFSNTLSVGVLRYTSGSYVADSAAAGATLLSANHELLMNADIEADVDGDGFGDETQDLCPGDPAAQAPPCASGAKTDRKKPKLTLSGKLRQKFTSVSVKAKSSEAGSVGATGYVNVPAAERVHFTGVLKSVRKNRKVTLRMKLSAADQATLRAALRKGSRLKAKLRVTATDNSGNAKRKNRTIKLAL